MTADGRVRSISDEQDADLFWAIRGGGGNFGVVTDFEYQLHPFERKLLSGAIMWPIDQVRDVLEFYGEWSAGLSDELYVGPMLMTTPDGVGLIAMEVVYNGDPAAGEKELEPLRNLGTPMMDGITMQDYTVMQTSEDAAFGHGVRSYAKNAMIKEFSQELVDAMIDAYVPDPRIFIASHVAGGAVKRVGELDTAFPHRNAEIMMVIVSGWMDPAQDAEAIAATREVYSKFAPFAGGYYDNIDNDGEGATSNYGPAHARLAQVKGRVDSGNLFRLNSNIEPAV